LSHPNIVSVYDVSRGGDTEYIVMELIDGITLKQYMEKRGQLNWRESLHFITQIMRGLSHAHSRGIVHRDIKPQNVMVLRDGSVKVADFGIARVSSGWHSTLTQEALDAAHELGYPVLVRPSYVLGGQGMEIAYTDRNIEEFMKIINMTVQEHPILVDKYLMGRELEVDGVFDGEDILIPGIMEHVERAGVHSGDSIAVYPPFSIGDRMLKTIVDCSGKLALSLGTRGLINIQYLIYQGELYVIEVNPRASRTVPYISKVTGVPMVDLATRVMVGRPLKSLGYGTGLCKQPPYTAVKVPVFSFEKLTDVDTGLGPEMKSTGEAIGYDDSLNRALYKALKAANMRVANYGTVFVTIADDDKPQALPLIRRFYNLGFNIEATLGTAKFLRENGVRTRGKKKLSEGSEEILDSMRAGHVTYVINTLGANEWANNDGFEIRRCAVENNVTMFTSLDTVSVLLDVLEEITVGVSTIDSEGKK